MFLTGYPSSIVYTIIPNGVGGVTGTYSPASFSVSVDTTGFAFGVYDATLHYAYSPPDSNLPVPTYSGTFTLVAVITLTTPYTCGIGPVVLNWTEVPGGDDSWYVKRNGTLIQTVVGHQTYTDTSLTLADLGNTYEYTITGFDSPNAVSNTLPVYFGLCPPTWPGCEGPQLTVTAPSVAGATAYNFFLDGVAQLSQSSNVIIFTGLQMETPYTVAYEVVVGGVTSPMSPSATFSPCPLCAWSPVPRPACTPWTPKPPV